eukprot:CAMPEP_0172444100 /NCGR_PEP_ID=MMETSP1065-20121228/4210_1 /TAXON_ID=265537 /ORGANISM="Amphiprora paludosa, Strain CCMP125" /LENGTH=454 /DNA_ID=CAMNT_0013194519 /DNA_START=480 /DNA_END=1844 /DNA_ORIENTATION=+
MAEDAIGHQETPHSSLLRNLGPDTLLHSPTENRTAPVSQILTPGKVTLFYFSAYWCGPCKKVTPILKEWYLSMKGQREKYEDFELVYVSLDAFEKEYQFYTKDMPWWCLPFNSPIASQLSQQYNTGGGIPSLVVVDADGETILHKDAVPSIVGGHGSEFPWRPQPIMKLLPETYEQNNEILPTSQLDDKYLMIFAGGHWCEPCRGFATKLSKAYEALKQRRNDFEILYLSSDLDEDAFLDFSSSMPFGAIPYEYRDAKMNIASKYSIAQLPTVVMLGPVSPLDGYERPIINIDVRSIFEESDSSSRYLQEFPYPPQRCGDFNRTTEDINNIKAVVVFDEYCDDCEQEDVEEAMQCAAEAYHQQPQQSQGGDLKFFWVHKPTSFSQTLRGALKLPDRNSSAQSVTACTSPIMVMLDFPDNGGYYVANVNEMDEDDLTTTSILEFVKNPGPRLSIM